jgi:hypothetical protein
MKNEIERVLVGPRFRRMMQKTASSCFGRMARNGCLSNCLLLLLLLDAVRLLPAVRLGARKEAMLAGGNYGGKAADVGQQKSMLLLEQKKEEEEGESLPT